MCGGCEGDSGEEVPYWRDQGLDVLGSAKSCVKYPAATRRDARREDAVCWVGAQPGHRWLFCTPESVFCDIAAGGSLF